MTATPITLELTAKELEPPEEGGGGGAYAEIDVPADYELFLDSVEDYDKRSEGKSKGWLFTYLVETPSGGEVPFRVFLAHSAAAKWKILEVLRAHEADLSEGLNNIDPSEFVGDVIGGHIDFPRDKDTDEPTSNYREIRQFFALATESDIGFSEEAEAPEVL